MALKYSFILEAIDRLTAPVKKAAGAVTGLGRAGKSANAPIAGAARSTASLGRSAARAGGGVDDLTRKSNKASRAVRLLRVAVRRPMSLVVRTKMDEGKVMDWAKRQGRQAGTLFGLGVRGAMLASGLVSAGGYAIGKLTERIVQLGREAQPAFKQSFDAVDATATSFIDGFLLKIGNAGLFDWLIKRFEQFNAWIAELTSNGKLDEWARTISAAITGIGDAVIGVDWAKLAGDVVDIAEAIGDFGSAIADIGGGGLSGLFNMVIIGIIAKTAFSLYGLATALGVVSVAGAPIWAIVLAIAAVAAGAFLVYRNWDKISAWFAAQWEALKASVSNGAEQIVAYFRSMWARAKQAFLDGVNAIWNMLPGWMQKVLNGGTFSFRVIGNIFGGQSVSSAVGNAAVDSGLRPKAPPAKTANPVSRKVAVSSHSTVDITVNGAANARLAGVKSTGDGSASAKLNRGTAMA